MFICTEYWMNTTHSTTLRNYMCEHGYFAEIYHFKETPLFEKVTASFVVFKFVKSGERRSTIRLYRYNKTKGLPSSGELAARSCFDAVEIPHFRKGSRWVLATQEVQRRLSRFEKSCRKKGDGLFDAGFHRIGDFCDIGNGMVSGLDNAFQIKDTSGLNEDERSVLIRVMKAKDLCAYKSRDVTNYIFIQEDIDEDGFRHKYPHLAAHFRPNLERLASRYSYNRDIPYWEFVFPRNQKLFERQEPRIFIPCKERISNKQHFRFCYAPAGYYPTQDVTAIFRKKSCKESIEYVLACLNNERVFEWLGLNGVVKGAIVEFSEAPIASIPYRPIDWNDKTEVEIHQQVTDEVRGYMSDSSERHISNINHLINRLFHES